MFGSGGVEPSVLQPGREMIAASSDVVLYSTQPRRKDENFHDLITKNNGPVTFSAYVIYEVIKEEAANLHQNFGANFYENNIQQQFRTMVRDFARNHTVTELTTEASITSAGAEQILKELRERVKKDNMPVNMKEVIIGAVSPPKEVIDETARTQAQQQRSQTESARAKAELSRKEAETNKAVADRAYASTFGMSAQEFLVYRNLENQKEMIEVVKDKQNVNILVQTGSGAMPTFSMSK